MKTKIFILSFIVITILLSVLSEKKQKNTEIATKTATSNTELRETATNNETQDFNNDEGNDQLYNWKKIDAKATEIIGLVRKRDKEVLSKMIEYPLKREYPIPPVKNKEDFIKCFDEIFDSSLFEKISNVNPKDLFVSWRGTYMTQEIDSISVLFLGFNCLSDDYSIFFIECSSYEKLKRDRLIEAERKDLHKSLKTFIYPVVLMETPTLLIRIDCIEERNDSDSNLFRYASWEKSKSISDKPDLILNNGVRIIGGSESHIAYIFTNLNTGYECNVRIWGDAQSIELFRIYKNFKIDEYGEMDGELILEQGTQYRSDYKKGDEIKLIYWSEEQVLRK